ncbi:DUF4238 domain-containing protein [Ensifer sp. PDNC004]|uniref:DUF4238 domain-containing protein n=1 Tax=Ensifer sp. PDNC004 TaxID=2811423 RepID=UPI001962435A|nr:DUF4238 domain-containing protein [Ensifer sp. PDNC004]QRY69108.1 DUF4238 domain-containing protein [Ensifer sp. PDNC004]
MNTPKRHHFVPQLLQENFVDERGKFWVYDCRNSKKAPFQSTPINTLVQGQLYSLVNCDGSTDASLEAELSRLESETKPIIAKIVASTRADEMPGLTSQERRTWDRFFLQQWQRVPDQFERLRSPAHHREETSRHLDFYSSVARAVTEDERRMFLDPAQLERSRQNLRVTSLREEAEDQNILAVMATRGLAFAKVPPHSSLILSSNPVMKLTGEGVTHLRDDRVKVWLPIAFDVLVGMGCRGVAEIGGFASEEYVTFLNTTQARQSSQIVSGTRTLVETFAPIVGSKLLDAEPLFET